MPFEVSWLQPKRVILARQLGVLTVDELEAEVDLLNQMRAEGIEPVYILLDSTALKQSVLPLSEVRRITSTVPKSANWIIFIGLDAINRFIASLAAQIAGMRFRFLASHAEALQFLHEGDSTIMTLDQLTAQSSP